MTADSGFGPISGLIELIYGAALEPALWSRVVAGISSLLGSQTMLRISAEDRSRPLLHVGDFDPDFIASYDRYYAPLNPWTRARAPRQDGMLVSHAVIDPAAVQRTEFYADWLRPQDLLHAVNFQMGPVQDRAVDLLVERSARRGVFTPAEQSQLRGLRPHMRRAVEIALRLELDRMRSAVMDFSQRRLGLGLLVVDAALRPLFMDPAAEQLLSTGQGLRLLDRRLGATLPALDQRLQAAVAQAAGAAGRSRGDSFSVPRAGSAPVSVTVTPFAGSPPASALTRPAAMLMLSAPELGAAIDPQALQAHYGLTPSEARLAKALCDGLSLADYAASAQVSLNTVRFHLKGLFAKLGENRQAGLIRKLSHAGGLQRL